MGTYTAIHIEETGAGDAQDALFAYLQERYDRSFEPSSGGPGAAEEVFLYFQNTEVFPTRLAIARHTDGYLHVLYNSWCPMEDVSLHLAKKRRVILVHGQTTSDAYLMALYKNGAQRRLLEFAAGGWIRQEGAPLPFETDPLGRNISEDEDDPHWIFEWDEVEAYCRQLGCHPWSEDITNWQGYLRQDGPAPKPWWKFWK